MLARAVPRLPDGAGCPSKADGYRCLAVVAVGRLKLQSRSGGDMTTWFPGLAGPAEPGLRSTEVRTAGMRC